MTLTEYIRDECPKLCGVNPVFGEVAELIFTEEMTDNPIFAADKFESVRERACLGLPYRPKYDKEYERCLDVLELTILRHRQERHGEDHGERIAELEGKRRYSADEIDIIATEWWNA